MSEAISGRQSVVASGPQGHDGPMPCMSLPLMQAAFFEVEL
jgi:hypothetical protein